MRFFVFQAGVRSLLHCTVYSERYSDSTISLEILRQKDIPLFRIIPYTPVSKQIDTSRCFRCYYST